MMAMMITAAARMTEPVAITAIGIMLFELSI